MTVTSDRLSEIARSLNRLQWQPTADEVAFGRAFFQQIKKAEEEHGRVVIGGRATESFEVE